MLKTRKKNVCGIRKKNVFHFLIKFIFYDPFLTSPVNASYFFIYFLGSLNGKQDKKY